MYVLLQPKCGHSCARAFRGAGDGGICTHHAQNKMDISTSHPIRSTCTLASARKEAHEIGGLKARSSTATSNVDHLEAGGWMRPHITNHEKGGGGATWE
jgi:hypothetical protein